MKRKKLLATLTDHELVTFSFKKKIGISSDE